MTTNHTDLIRELREYANDDDWKGRIHLRDASILMARAADALEAIGTPSLSDANKQSGADALEAMQADAARYRWLRGGADIPLESNRWARWEVRYWCGRWWSTMFADQLDTAIDAARGKE